MQGRHVEEKPGFVLVEDLCGIDGGNGLEKKQGGEMTTDQASTGGAFEGGTAQHR